MWFSSRLAHTDSYKRLEIHHDDVRAVEFNRDHCAFHHYQETFLTVIANCQPLCIVNEVRQTEALQIERQKKQTDVTKRKPDFSAIDPFLSIL
jgi:hypothetical protein